MNNKTDKIMKKAISLASKWYDSFTTQTMTEEQGHQFMAECGDAEMAETVMRLIAIRASLLN